MAHVLVIDDDQDFRESVVDSLLDAGYQVSDADNPFSALGMLRHTGFDAVLTDILMPEQDGIYLIRQLNDQQTSVKIIAMSGGGRIGAKSYIAMAEALGVAGTLTKPFLEEQLLSTLDSCGVKPS